MSTDIKVAKHIRLVRRIESGAFGEVFYGFNERTHMEVAVKLEPINTKHPQLFFEAKLYQYMLKDKTVIDKGIPNLYYAATEGDYNVMVMDLLGPSLEQLFS